MLLHWHTLAVPEVGMMKTKILTVARNLAWLAILLGLVACSQGTGGDVVDEMVDIGGHSLHIYCMGEGSPPVVIDVGFAASSANWHTIQEQMAQDTRVCAYERAGYGQSDPGPEPRHSQQVAGELKTLLENAGIEGPYVLVGHSLGGLNVQVFVDLYPDLVAGAVLLDPPPLGFITGERFPELYQMAEQESAGLLAAAEQARGATDPEEKAKASFHQTLASEHAMMTAESGEQVVAIESFGDMPLMVLASGKPNPAFGDSAEAFQQYWNQQNQALATKSANGTYILAEESGHHLYADAPDLVLDAVRQVVQEARR
jgi:pimeloyl-ACP methyl ester carboxylesterase